MHPGSTQPVPPPIEPTPRPVKPPPADPVVAVLGNASGLGLGYALIRRPMLAVGALIGTVLLLALIVNDPESWVWRVLLAVWWLAAVGHAFWITRRPASDLVDPEEADPQWRPRVFTAGVVVLALVTIAWNRFDAAAIVDAAEGSHEAGDCQTAAESLRRLGTVHRFADGPTTVRGEEALEACELLLEAEDADPIAAEGLIETYLDHPGARWEGAGPLRAERLLEAVVESPDSYVTYLERAFAQLSASLEDTPDQAERVRGIVEGFLSDFPEAVEACVARNIDDWLQDQDWAAPELSGPVAADAAQVPPRVVACGRALFEEGELEAARETYERFLADYPDHELVPEATAELEEVETAIERENVIALIDQETYCDSPAPYRAAPTYEGEGPHAMQTFGIDPFEYDFPESWMALDVDDTVLVLCVEGPERGSLQATCAYEAGASAIQPISGYVDVDFYATRFEVRAFELRTGERVAAYSAEVGDPCPDVLEYESYGYLDTGPPSEVDSDYSDEDVREIFSRLMD
ncbi:hypothetical protein GCM10029992_34390 [Glycomyces albus]